MRLDETTYDERDLTPPRFLPLFKDSIQGVPILSLVLLEDSQPTLKGYEETTSTAQPWGIIGTHMDLGIEGTRVEVVGGLDETALKTRTRTTSVISKPHHRSNGRMNQ